MPSPANARPSAGPASAPTAAEGDKDGRFEVRVEDGDVRLLVFPPRGRGKRVETAHVAQALKAKGLAEWDEAKVELAVHLANGEPVVVGRREAKGGRAEVTVSPDGLEAYLVLHPPEGGGAPVDRAAVDEAIRAAGVQFGLLDDAIAEMLEKRIVGVQKTIARGRPSRDGEDGRVVWRVEREGKRPKEDAETGRVDHRELGLIVNVRKGDLLAEVLPPTDGEPGMTVRGNVVAPKPGRKAENPAGKNAEVSADGREVRAAIDGRVSIGHEGGRERVSVQPVFDVHGNVGPETGNVHFVGSVNVHGTVEDGFTIEAGQDVTVGGVVEKAVIKAGGSVVIRGGILGKREGMVEAGGDVRTKFVQDGNVSAMGDVFVEEFAMHSQIEGDRVIVGTEGKRSKRNGLLIGGSTRATREVACHVLGSPMSAKTDVQVGVNPKVLRRLDEMTKQLEADKQTFDRVRKGLAVLDAVKAKVGALPPEKEGIYAQLRTTEETLRVRLVEMAEEIRGLNAQTAREFRAKVSVMAETHPGVRIQVRNEALYVTKENTFTTYILDGGKIRPVPYEAPRLREKGDETDGKRAAG